MKNFTEFKNLVKEKDKMKLRKKFKHGMFIIHSYNGNVVVEVNDILYYWDSNATTGCPGAVQHGGNSLYGTEFRRSAQSQGDWVQYPHLSYGHVVMSRGLGHRSNFYPNYNGVLNALRGSDDGWETTNPEHGKNDEWIPWVRENTKK